VTHENLDQAYCPNLFAVLEARINSAYSVAAAYPWKYPISFLRPKTSPPLFGRLPHLVALKSDSTREDGLVWKAALEPQEDCMESGLEAQATLFQIEFGPPSTK